MRFAPLTPKPKPTKAWIRRCIVAFEERGFSSHSTVGAIGAHILNHCVQNGIPFVVAYIPDGGYTIWRAPKDPADWAGFNSLVDEFSGAAVDKAKPKARKRK